MSELLKFVSTPQAYPEKIGVEERKSNFAEIYQQFAANEAAEQAARCSQCGVPFCQVHCPLGNNIPDWLKLTAEGRLQEAYQVSAETNNFPEICGRICPQDRLCEGNCVIEKGFNSVTIGSVERYITENAFANDWVKPAKPKKENGISIGIIGAGPAGLAAADMMRRKGYQVHIYDRYDRAGGLMIYGIPSFKLEKSIIERRYKLLKQAGIIFHLGFEVGKKSSLTDLKKKHAAILIATGVYKPREIEIPDCSLDGVYQALDYLTASNKDLLGDKVPEYLNAAGKSVVVIGGGDTAMDCVRTAIRQGASKVSCIYRRDRENMPGSSREVKNAEEEGVEFLWLSAPKAFAGYKKIEKVLGIKMRLSMPDASGRSSPVVIPDSDFTIKADMVIKALGFDAENIPVEFGVPELKISKSGTIAIDNKNFMTSMEGVFAAGDIVRGASLVVWAIKDGRDAAEAMDTWLQ